MPAYDTIQSWFDRFCAEGERSKNKMQWNSKLLIRYLIDNTRGHISHCTQTTLLAKNPRVLSTETRIRCIYHHYYFSYYQGPREGWAEGALAPPLFGGIKKNNNDKLENSLASV